MRSITRLLIVAIAIVLVVTGPAVRAGDEGELVSLVNASRAAAGLPAVTVDGGLAAAAEGHSASMLASGAVYHAGDITGGVSGWEALAENVGAGSSVGALHEAFMASAGHRRNILGDYEFVGVGVVRDGEGRVWVTVRFMRKWAVAATTSSTTTTSTTSPTAPAPPTTAPPAAAEAPVVRSARPAAVWPHRLSGRSLWAPYIV